VAAFKDATYAGAVSHFQAAVAADADCMRARLYLATAYMQQYIPGADTPDNLQMAVNAHAQFERAFEKDPNNKLAIASVASL